MQQGTKSQMQHLEIGYRWRQKQTTVQKANWKNVDKMRPPQ